jgi:hypothetical protein
MTGVVSRQTEQFVVADLDARGELHARQAYRYDDLVQLPLAAELIGEFSAAIWKSPEAFELNPISSTTRISCRWRASAATAGIVTLRYDQAALASLSLLACGIDSDADKITLAAFQRHLLQELHDTGYEPAFDLVSLTDRPLVATINILSPPDPDVQMAIALSDRCFAASYFRYQGLV